MSISGIGSLNTYIYNSQTKKLSTKDGSKDAFVDYFNGDISGDDSDSLNGFDIGRKNGIETMIEIWSSDQKGNIFNDPAKTEFEITTEVVDAGESRDFIDGKKAFTDYYFTFLQCIDKAELKKAMHEKFLAEFNEKYNVTPDHGSNRNVESDTAQNAVPVEGNGEEHRRFVIPVWLENKALKEYEEWLCKPLSERTSAVDRRQ